MNLRHLRCHPDGFVQISGIDEKELDGLSLCFSEGAVGNGYLAVHEPYRDGGLIALEILNSE